MAEDQRIRFRALLESIGLSGADVEQLITDAVTNTWGPDTFLQNVYQTNTFKQQYPEYEARIRAGLDTWDPSVIRHYRNEAKRLMFDAGLPPGVFDQDSDLSALITGDVSLEELSGRIKEGFDRVRTAPPEVRDAFSSFFGAQGDAALATFFLDPTRADDFLQKAVQQAEFSGTGRRFGFNIDLAEAERLRALGIDSRTAARGFEQAEQLKPLSEETISETADITEQELVEGAFGVGSTDAARRRAQERTAAFGGTGGPATTKEGFGLGTAR